MFALITESEGENEIENEDEDKNEMQNDMRDDVDRYYLRSCPRGALCTLEGHGGQLAPDDIVESLV